MYVTGMTTQRITHQGVIITAELDDTYGIHCPACGSDDVGQWADDGEADSADYWECEDCHAHGAMLGDDGIVTPNGITVDPATV